MIENYKERNSLLEHLVKCYWKTIKVLFLLNKIVRYEHRFKIIDIDYYNFYTKQIIIMYKF